MSPDHDLRRRIRSGDQDAFAELYEQHVDAVHALAYRLTGDRASAEDVASETFLVAWRSRATLTLDERPLRPWLLAVATRQALNARRSVRRRVAFLARRTVEPVPDFADEAVGRLDDARALGRTREALAQLGRHETEVLALCVWSGLSYAEAAGALGVPVGTVRSRLSRARTRLRALAMPSPDPSADPSEALR